MQSHGRSKRDKGRQDFRLSSLEGRALLSTTWADGKDNALAYDATNDRTWVAFYDAVAHNLKVTSKTGAGAWTTPQTIVNDASGVGNDDYGNYVSIALDSNKNPGVAYYDAYNADVRFAKYNASTGQFNNSVLVDGYKRTGMYPSLAFAGTGTNAAITYYSASGKSLRMATLNGALNLWTVDILPVDTDANPLDGVLEDIGRYSSLKFNPGTSRWSVAYERTGDLVAGVDGEARYADQALVGWSKTVLKTTEVGGGYTALAFDGNNPGVAYYDAYNGDLIYSERAGSTWTTTTVSATGTTGLYNSLWYKNGKAQIATYRKSGAGSPSLLKFDENTAWGATSLFAGGGSEAKAFEKPSGEVVFSLVAVTSDPGDPLATPAIPASTSYTLQLRSDADAALGTAYGRTNTDTTYTFSRRAKMGAVTFDNKMWVFGGNGGSADLGDMYSSTDGYAWTAQTLTGDAISARSGFGMVTANGKMFIVGGSGNTDVFSSTDGLAWTRKTSSATFLGGLSDYATVAHNGNLYVIGGQTSSGLTNAVWKSTDEGATWSQVSVNTPFNARRGHGAVSYQGELWIAGGVVNASINQAASDLWHSPDNGATWYQVTQGVFSARADMTLSLYDNRMWVVGGVASGVRKNDVYYSTDGITWRSAINPAPFAARSGHSTLEYNGKLWVLAGYDGSPTSQDVWAST
ncbi:MAG: hypothetical protein ACAI43_19685 [Phycisphaerae bacterium]|nr:hypothetical protein [Tepidisphaeraceae bacterium]